MTISHYRLLGGPGSPYSLKMRAILRYRRIPHVWIVPRGYIGSGGELAAAGKGIIPVLQLPDGSYHADSTPLAYLLEQRHPGERSLIPDDPAMAFVSHLIEDMADEMLVSAMFDLRWRTEEDQQFCARRQLSGWLSPIANAELDPIVDRFTRRQTANRARIMDGGGNVALLTRLYGEVLVAIERMLETRPFVLGMRPGLADFGLFGQLSQCAIDPSAARRMRAEAVRTFQWTQSMDDCSGIDGEWAAPGDWGDAVHLLLDVVGRYYLPMMVANAGAAVAQAPRYEVEIEGERWAAGTERYKQRCLGWLRAELAAMPAAAREGLRPLLAQHGCWDALAPGASPGFEVPPMATR